MERPVDWTGWYAGLIGGATGLGHSSLEFPGVSTADMQPSGWLGGGTLGYNFQKGKWVFGVEGDLAKTNTEGSNQCAPLVQTPIVIYSHCPRRPATTVWTGLRPRRRGSGMPGSSLNDTQAVVDSDGLFRFVVSKADPGVPNWLDKADHPWGIIQMRFNRGSDYPDPTIKKVKVSGSSAGHHLPAHTPVVSPEERVESLRRRREGAQFRRIW